MTLFFLFLTFFKEQFTRLLPSCYRSSTWTGAGCAVQRMYLACSPSTAGRTARDRVAPSYTAQPNSSGKDLTEMFSNVADPGCLSRIPDPGSKRFSDPGSASTSKNLSILTKQKLVLSFRKYDSGCPSRIRILIFLPSRIPDPGVKKASDPGSATLIFLKTYL